MIHFNLLIEMYAKGMTKEKLAEKLKISEQELNNKINGLLPFSEEEKDVIKTIFQHCEDDYLFNEM